ncbi:response regulator transcription factor [Paenibacillus woosongensis]|uniref:Response regulator transcription factor n=1 Tax=Paenibacillus woosongensis TaxID=307580 RepID=A0AA95L0E5_9BACL|nr:response regulator transcription factor [Paenibacillus woosongensis]WHX48129.1 response regulator transcription factor [Paenibacillus woosongensis]GIP60700.1 putative transcriptional regulatory protein YcbL [Paenibacillus woosongensis]
MNQNILLVEDDGSISEMVINCLSKEGFSITLARDGEEALRLFGEQSYALVLLDLMLPYLNGMDFLKKIREHSRVPVLIVSAKDSEVDKALGLGFGADDYIAKPFSLIELTARVKAAIRRATEYSDAGGSASHSPKIITVKDMTMDIDNIRLTKHGREIHLTAKEWSILKLLFTYPRKIFTKEQIYRSVWGDEYYGDENMINVHISRLRDKIEDHPSSPQYIKTIWGIGYKLGDFQE